MGHPSVLGWLRRTGNDKSKSNGWRDVSTPERLWLVEENGRALHDAHLSDDEAAAKMGHPIRWYPTHTSESTYGVLGLCGDR
jgi:hypothetical protein